MRVNIKNIDVLQEVDLVHERSINVINDSYNVILSCEGQVEKCGQICVNQ